MNKKVRQLVGIYSAIAGMTLAGPGATGTGTGRSVEAGSRRSHQPAV